MKNEMTAKRLLLALSNANIKPQELADRSGVSKSSISQYVNGSHAPSNISSGKIGKVLNVNPLWLMGFDVPMERTNVVSSNSITFYNVHCESKSEADLVLAYRKLSDISKRKVSAYANNLLEIEKADHELKAAHERTDIEITDEMRQYDDDIMNDPDF